MPLLFIGSLKRSSPSPTWWSSTRSKRSSSPVFPVTGLAPARRAAEALVASGFGAAVVTLAERGAVWADGTDGGHVAAPRVKVVDTVGAGDTFVGYLACDLARGVPLGEGVQEAVRAAALAVTRRGAQPGIPRRPDLARGTPARTGVRRAR